MKLTEYIKNWIDTYAFFNVKESTYRTYLAAYKQILTVEIDKDIKNYFEDDVQNIINALYINNNYSKSTLKTAKIVLTKTFDKAVRNRIIKYNPATNIIIPLLASKKKVSALTLEEQDKIIDACKYYLHGDKFIFLMLTGLRRSEMCNLEWSDYSAQKAGVCIRKSKTKNGIRFIPLLKEAILIIESQPRINKYIFNSKIGMPLNSTILQRTYNQIRKRTGITSFTNHVCRHTFATRLIEHGADIKAVSALLGHSSVEFTLNTYADAQPEHLREAIEKLTK